MNDIPYCIAHDLVDAGAPVCRACASVERRDTLSILEARIADHDQEISGLRRQINALEHRMNDLQRALNAHVRL
ncbi:MAG: hypothetical protein M3R61_00085 [Chloroflexota bacterium]|nr:hypothetical protein [Chloroflexota bacterium]